MDGEEMQFLGMINKDNKDKEKKTSGFGLFISNQIANYIEGRTEEERNGIVVHSDKGKGSCFSFHIKDFKDDKESSCSFLNSSSRKDIISHRTIEPYKRNLDAKSLAPKLLNTVGRKIQIYCNCIKVLIVDDSPFNLETCQILLKKNGIESDLAHNGEEAVKIANASVFNKRFCEKCRFYKLILMDIDMPIKNGIEATKELKIFQENQKLKFNIVGISAFHQEEIKKQGLDAGMVNYFLKPINIVMIKDLIQTYLNN